MMHRGSMAWKQFTFTRRRRHRRAVRTGCGRAVWRGPPRRPPAVLAAHTEIDQLALREAVTRRAIETACELLRCQDKLALREDVALHGLQHLTSGSTPNQIVRIIR